MDKKQAINYIKNEINRSLNEAIKERDASQAEANNHIGAMESRYDSFKEEAQHMVFSLNKRISELTEISNKTSALLNSMDMIHNNSNSIVLSSIIELTNEEDVKKEYFLAPSLGGHILEIDNTPTTIITPNSPIGKMLLGKSVDDKIELNVKGEEKYFYITSIK